MYSTVNIVSILAPIAEKFIMENDRAHFDVFLSAIEKLCAERRAIIGGAVGRDILLGIPMHKGSYLWEIYVGGALTFSRDLADILATIKSNHVPANTTAMLTFVYGREFAISINAIIIARITDLPDYRGKKTVDMIEPTSTVGYFGSIVNVMPVDIQLANVYRDLYSPAKCGDWQMILDHESRLAAMFVRGHEREHDIDRHRGREHDIDRHRAHISGNFGGQIAAILREALRGVEHAFVGSDDKYQILSAISSTDLVSRMTKSSSARSLISRGFEFRAVSYYVGVIGDFQLEKYTIYMVSKSQLHCVDVFNSPAYEVLPVIVDNHAGAPMVQLRFLLVEFWVLRTISAISGSGHVAEKLKSFPRKLETIRQSVFADSKSMTDAFSLEGIQRAFIGTPINAITAKKQLAAKQKFAGPYYPVNKFKTGTGDSADDQEDDGRQSGKVSFNTTFDREGIIGYVFRSASRLQRGQPSLLSSIARSVIAKRATAANKGKWSWGDNVTPTKHGLLELVQNVDTALDIGCGDGGKLTAMPAKTKIYADVVNHTRINLIPGSRFVTVTPDNPLDVDDSSVDLITMIHVAHHATDAFYRFEDVVRMLKPGGHFMLRDHDVVDNESADNVTFEHFCWSSIEVDMPNSQRDVEARLIKLANEFDTFEPMTYYSADQYAKKCLSLGLVAVASEPAKKSTRVFSILFKKPE